MKFFQTIFLVALIFLAIPAGGFCQEKPVGGVWVAPHKLPDGTVVPGFWRAPFRKGFYWVEGKEDNEGNWIPGYWQPLRKAPSGRAWAPGYWDGSIWVTGYWRPAARPGYLWVRHSWHNGRWRGGYWRAYQGGKPFRVPFPER